MSKDESFQAARGGTVDLKDALEEGPESEAAKKQETMGNVSLLQEYFHNTSQDWSQEQIRVHSQHLCLEERWIFKLRNKEK
jgi:hypothetical protein